MTPAAETRRVIDGAAVAAGQRARIARAVAGLKKKGFAPGLATVLVGEDPASRVYVRNKIRACREAGIESTERAFPAAAQGREILDEIARLNRDPAVDGILVQLPLPASIDPDRVLAAVDPGKDVDGFHPENAGRLAAGRGDCLIPCTPQGCMILIESARPDLEGLDALVIGRSNIVGKPVAQLLLAAHCTVTIAHSRTRGLADRCRAADVVVAAAGRARMVQGEWIKPGATVIDVGINRIPAGNGRARLVGDVDFDAARARAGAITPVPGGVGPMTVACLLRNTVVAACRRRGVAPPGT